MALGPLKQERYVFEINGRLAAGNVPVASITQVPGGIAHVDRRGVHDIVDLPKRMYLDGFVWRVEDHDDCQCNELVSLHNRHLLDDPSVRVSDAGLSELRSVMFEMVAAMPLEALETWSYEKVIHRMPAHKRARYWLAMKRLRDRDVDADDAQVKMMLKAEKFESAKLDEGKAGRAIQYRSPEYNLALMAAGLKSVEHEFYGAMRFGVSGTRNVAKCLNQSQRARLLREKWEAFSDPVAVLLDAKAWDAHVHTPLLKLEHDFYNKCMPGNSRFAWLLSMQINNRGRTKYGIKYKIRGTRMSGDPNTALGNCVLNLMMLRAWLRRCGVSEFDILLDGDDSVVIVNRRDLSRLDDTAIANNYGFQMKMETTDEFEAIDFCQCRPVHCFEGWRMVRYPDRLMSKDVVCVRNMCDRWHALCDAIGQAELALNSGVPVLQEFAIMLIRAGAKGKILNRRGRRQIFGEQVEYAGNMQARSTGRSAVAVPVQTRLSFWKAFDVSPDVQLHLERWLNQHDPIVHPIRASPVGEVVHK